MPAWCKGAARVSRASHWTRPGCACLPHAHRPVWRRLSTPRWAEAVSPGALALAWTPALASPQAAWRRPEETGAAPAPSLPLTGAQPSFSQPFAEAGRRAQHDCSVAEENLNGSLQAPCPWRRRLKKGLVPPCGWAPRHRNHGRTRDRRLPAPGPGKRKHSKKPLRGGVGRLTKGVLIRVRPGPRVMGA
jgi:hypothetical protein